MPARTKLTRQVLDQIVGALRVGADLAMACRAVGVTRQALQKRCKRDTKLRAEIDEARDFADDVIVKRLYDKAKEGDNTAMIFWLKNRQRHRWRDKWPEDSDGPIVGEGGVLVVGGAPEGVAAADWVESVRKAARAAQGNGGASK